MRGLNKIIDSQLPSRPRFTLDHVVVAGESFEFYHRNILQCIEALYSDPEFAPYLKYAPEHRYTGPDESERIYHDMETGNWWWKTQVYCSLTPIPNHIF